MKMCVACRWAENGQKPYGQVRYCGRPGFVRVGDGNDFLPTCVSERKDNLFYAWLRGECGRAARFFEQKAKAVS